MEIQRVLFVDDEIGVLEGYERLLRKEFAVFSASGGAQGLEHIDQHGPFAVIISDMRMPEMNGAEFLALAREKAPQSVRMLLTGFADMQAAIDAINRGNIYRFLTKPCTKDVLVDAIQIGIAQHHQLVAEQELIRKAQESPEPRPEIEQPDVCQWDNFLGPTGLAGPSQARGYLAPLFSKDPCCYVAMLKLTALQTIEERYGEAVSCDYLNATAHSLVQALNSQDRLFHWGRDVLMAVIHRHLSPTAMRSEMMRIAAAKRDHMLQANDRNVMIATPIEFEISAVLGFSCLDEMLECFDTPFRGALTTEL